MSETFKYGTEQRSSTHRGISEAWFKEGHSGGDHFLMEARTENMQSRKNEAKIHLLMHMRESSMVQWKQP